MRTAERPEVGGRRSGPGAKRPPVARGSRAPESAAWWGGEAGLERGGGSFPAPAAAVGPGAGAGRRGSRSLFRGAGPAAAAPRLLPRQVRAARRNAAGLTHQRLLPTCRPPHKAVPSPGRRPPPALPATRPPDSPGSPSRCSRSGRAEPSAGRARVGAKVGPASDRRRRRGLGRGAAGGGAVGGRRAALRPPLQCPGPPELGVHSGTLEARKGK